MFLYSSRLFYGWLVLGVSTLIVFGISGSQFSFGIFLKPMTEEFGWSRTTLSLAFGTTFMLSGLLRPVSGYLADRYSARTIALLGVALMGITLFLIPFITSLMQLYLIFVVMSVGVTLGTGPTLTKIISSWFHSNRGLVLGIVQGGGSVGAIILVPAASIFIILFDWREAYVFLGIFLILFVVPLAVVFLKNSPDEVGLTPHVSGDDAVAYDLGHFTQGISGPDRDVGFRDAIRTPFFWSLTFGYFV